ncbi:TetR/AcrR family transcriptional regulator [Streptomyces sp. NBC_01016]|uniref:TetR/AcrR family transcriptional regulator n=1 Tax=Streptomyces sp. NBC_01016 TaxID=2903720 RepID=UPI00224DE86D|nr:TetR/AcrR family transcriptional regulator [Streptomyces sp. NBC_01016]MCX4834402.1 TetR/AcrR family transcriptional regulator [Streptomyces sp. NBC_01016]
MTPEASRPPDPTRRNQRSHRAILDATFKLIARNGYAKVTIEAIASAAKVGKPTIYRWWPSKGALALDAINDRIGHVLDFPDTGNIAGDLVHQINEVIALFNSDVGTAFQGVIAEGQGDRSVAASFRDTVVEPRIRACQDRLAKAVAAGQLRNDVPTRAMTEMLYAPLYYRLLLGTDPLTTADSAALVERALEGLRPTSAPSPASDPLAASP